MYRDLGLNYWEEYYLNKFTKVIGESIPRVEKISENTFGFTVRDNKLTGLGLYNKDIRNNDLNFRELPHLEVLNLSKCKLIEYTPYTIDCLRQLRILYLNYCNFIPDVSLLLKIQNLKLLSLKHIPFTKEEREKLIEHFPNLKIISSPLNSSVLYTSFVKKKIAKEELLDYLKTSLKNSDFKYIRIDCLKILEKLELKTDNIFEILENTILFDSDWEVRIEAIEVIIKLYPLKCLNPVKQAIRNELYPIVLTETLNAIQVLNSSLQQIIKEEIIQKYAKFYELIPEEVEFIINLDSLNPMDDYGRPIKFDRKYKERNVYYSVKQIRYYMDRLIAKCNDHVIGLNIHRNIERIPESIQKLQKLRYFHIFIDRDGKNIEIPKSIENLKRLREFRIYSGDLTNFIIPDKLFKRGTEYFSRKFLWEGIPQDEAIILASLDLKGVVLDNVNNEEVYKEDPLWYFMGDIDVFHYKLDKLGHVKAVYIMPWEERRLSYFPEELCSLKYLQDLIIWGYNIKFIPESIIKLEALRVLKISNFNEQTINIPESISEFLNSLAVCRIQGIKPFRKNKVKINLDTENERIKTRLTNFIEHYISIPIEKLAQTLKIPNEEAENLIYELAAEGIEGTLEDDVFKFTSSSEDVISELYKLIGKR